MPEPIPVILFAYNRPEHLARTLDSLRANAVPRIIAWSDAPRRPEHAPSVEAVRRTLRAVDWCPVERHERDRNYGNGRSILEGVTEALARHPAALVFEDDIECAPGGYAWLCAALERYRSEARVMSVSGWTHPRVCPAGVGDRPYFDGRCATLGWGTWARSWQGMEQDARSLLRACAGAGVDPDRYGYDLRVYAEEERVRNIWAVRFILLHFLRRGLCLCPPWAIVAHRGYDAAATNAASDDGWADPPLRPCPPIPGVWPEPVEHPACAPLWRAAGGARPGWLRRVSGRARRALRRAVVAAGLK